MNYQDQLIQQSVNVPHHQQEFFHLNFISSNLLDKNELIIYQDSFSEGCLSDGSSKSVHINRAPKNKASPNNKSSTQVIVSHSTNIPLPISKQKKHVSEFNSQQSNDNESGEENNNLPQRISEKEKCKKQQKRLLSQTQYLKAQKRVQFLNQTNGNQSNDARKQSDKQGMPFDAQKAISPDTKKVVSSKKNRKSKSPKNRSMKNQGGDNVDNSYITGNREEGDGSPKSNLSQFQESSHTVQQQQSEPQLQPKPENQQQKVECTTADQLELKVKDSDEKTDMSGNINDNDEGDTNNKKDKIQEGGNDCQKIEENQYEIKLLNDEKDEFCQQNQNLSEQVAKLDCSIDSLDSVTFQKRKISQQIESKQKSSMFNSNQLRSKFLDTAIKESSNIEQNMKPTHSSNLNQVTQQVKQQIQLVAFSKKDEKVKQSRSFISNQDLNAKKEANIQNEIKEKYEILNIQYKNLQEKLKEKANRYENLNNTLEVLRKELKSLGLNFSDDPKEIAEQMRIMNSRSKQAEDEMKRMRDQYLKMKELLATCQSDLLERTSQLKNQKESYESQISQMQETFSKDHKQYQQFQKNQEDKKQQEQKYLETLQHKQKNYESELGNLQNMLTAKTSALVNLLNEKDSLSKQFQENQQRYERAIGKLATMESMQQKQIANSEEQCKQEIARQKQDYENIITKLKSEMEEKEQLTRQQFESILQYKQEIKVLEAGKQDLQREIDSFVERMTEERDQYNDTKQKLQMEIRTLTLQKEYLNKIIEEKSTEIKQLNNISTKQIEQIDSLQQQEKKLIATHNFQTLVIKEEHNRTIQELKDAHNSHTEQIQKIADKRLKDLQIEQYLLNENHNLDKIELRKTIQDLENDIIDLQKQHQKEMKQQFDEFQDQKMKINEDYVNKSEDQKMSFKMELEKLQEELAQVKKKTDSEVIENFQYYQKLRVQQRQQQQSMDVSGGKGHNYKNDSASVTSGEMEQFSRIKNKGMLHKDCIQQRFRLIGKFALVTAQHEKQIEDLQQQMRNWQQKLQLYEGKPLSMQVLEDLSPIKKSEEGSSGNIGFGLTKVTSQLKKQSDLIAKQGYSKVKQPQQQRMQEPILQQRDNLLTTYQLDNDPEYLKQLDLVSKLEKTIRDKDNKINQMVKELSVRQMDLEDWQNKNKYLQICQSDSEKVVVRLSNNVKELEDVVKCKLTEIQNLKDQIKSFNLVVQQHQEFYKEQIEFNKRQSEEVEILKQKHISENQDLQKKIVEQQKIIEDRPSRNEDIQQLTIMKTKWQEALKEIGQLKLDMQSKELFYNKRIVGKAYLDSFQQSCDQLESRGRKSQGGGMIYSPPKQQPREQQQLQQSFYESVATEPSQMQSNAPISLQNKTFSIKRDRKLWSQEDNRLTPTQLKKRMQHTTTSFNMSKNQIMVDYEEGGREIQGLISKMHCNNYNMNKNWFYTVKKDFFNTRYNNEN